MNSRYLSILFFSIFVAGTLTLALTLPGIFSGLARALPENYELPYKEAMSRGDHEAALEVAERRIEQSYYDLNAYYLKAEAEAALNRPAAAVETVETIFQRRLAASGRIDHAAGFDESRAWRMLAANLWDAGRESDAVDILRLGMDLGDDQVFNEMKARARIVEANPQLRLEALEILSLDKKSSGTDTLLASLPPNPETSTGLASYWIDRGQLARAENVLNSLTSGTAMDPVLPETWSVLADLQVRQKKTSSVITSIAQADNSRGVRRIVGEAFTIPDSARVNNGQVDILRNSHITATAQPSAFGASMLILRLSGSRAVGVAPLIKVVINDQTKRYIYIDRSGPQTEIIKFSESAATEPVSLKIEFLNDAFDPTTRDDRNVSILDAWLV